MQINCKQTCKQKLFYLFVLQIISILFFLFATIILQTNCKQTCKQKIFYLSGFHIIILYSVCTSLFAGTNFANKNYFILLYFVLLGTLSSVFTISFAATNSANKRETVDLSFSCSLSRVRASLLLIVSIESRYRNIEPLNTYFSTFLHILSVKFTTLLIKINYSFQFAKIQIKRHIAKSSQITFF